MNFVSFVFPSICLYLCCPLRRYIENTTRFLGIDTRLQQVWSNELQFFFYEVTHGWYTFRIVTRATLLIPLVLLFSGTRDYDLYFILVIIDLTSTFSPCLLNLLCLVNRSPSPQNNEDEPPNSFLPFFQSRNLRVDSSEEKKKKIKGKEEKKERGRERRKDYEM